MYKWVFSGMAFLLLAGCQKTVEDTYNEQMERLLGNYSDFEFRKISINEYHYCGEVSYTPPIGNRQENKLFYFAPTHNYFLIEGINPLVTVANSPDSVKSIQGWVNDHLADPKNTLSIEEIYDKQVRSVYDLSCK